MAAKNRRQASDRQSVPRRASKRLQTANDYSQEPESTTSSTLATASANYELDTLPTELLRAIFWLAVEPALLHTNRRFWYLTKTRPEPTLPPYRDFTEKLAGLAMCGKAKHADNKIDVIGLKTMSLLSLPLAGLESTLERRLDPDKRKALQDAVFKSRWFGARQFDKVHTALFKSFLYEPIMDPANNHARSHIRKIERICDNTITMMDSPSWTITFNRDDCGRTNWSISQFEIVSHLGLRRWHSPLNTWEILDLARIPSELLRLPIDADKQNVLGRLTRKMREPPRQYDDTIFDPSLFKPALDFAIDQASSRNENTELLETLLMLAKLKQWFHQSSTSRHGKGIISQTPCGLEIGQLRSAALAGSVACVRTMLYNSRIVIEHGADVEALEQEVYELKTTKHGQVARLLAQQLERDRVSRRVFEQGHPRVSG